MKLNSHRATNSHMEKNVANLCFVYFFLFRFQSPPKGATIPYRPKPQINTPVLLANGQAYTIQGSYVPTQEVCNAISLNIFFSSFDIDRIFF